MMPESDFKRHLALALLWSGKRRNEVSGTKVLPQSSRLKNHPPLDTLDGVNRGGAHSSRLRYS